MKKKDIFKKIMGDLTPYNRSIYLTCCIGVEYDYDIVSHFIKHYKKLGIDKFLIVLNTHKKKSKKLKYVQNILRKYSVEEKIIWIGDFNDWIKTDHMNQLLLNYTSSEDWVVFADIDEFQKYPTDLKRFVFYCEKMKYNCVMGEYVDMLTKTGEIINIKENTNLWEEFLIKTKLRWNDTPYMKLVLAKSCIKMLVGHHGPSKEVIEDCSYYPYKLEVDHFKWRGNLLNSAKNRIKAFKRNGHNWWFIAQNVIDYYEEHGSFLDIK